MADNFNENTAEEAPENAGADVSMVQDEENGNMYSGLPPAEQGPENPDGPQMSFLSYLTSPIVTLVVGNGDAAAVLTAHQALLEISPYFNAVCTAFAEDGSPRTIELADFDLDALGCFLEYLYTGDYFPKKLPGQRQLEGAPSIPRVDETGEQLLRHARVYTLAEKLQVPALQVLSHSKIHCVNSTAKGEIAYARYVYEFTSKTDVAIREPVAHFWAMRSHTLRAEAEQEFRLLCLEHPQFGYDVLTRVLDEKLKRERNEKMQPTTGSARKRLRHGSNAA